MGQKLDKEKPRWDLLPLGALSATVDVLTFGARKYAPDNWRKVPDARRRYLAATWRHIVAWGRGSKADPESGQHHLAHAICCLLFILELELEGESKPEGE